MSSSKHRARIWRSVASGFLGCTLLAGSATAWEIRPEAPAADLEELHRHIAPALYPYPRHDASPLGLAGFEIYIDAAHQAGFASRDFAASTIDGEMSRGALSVARVGVRKGLPARLDLGASYGRVLGSDLDIAAADVKWALRDGGPFSPSVALRVAGAQTRGSELYRLRQVGAEVMVSQQLTVLTPYVGGGLVRSQSRFHRPGGALQISSVQPIVYLGATLHLLLPRITVEVERGEVVQVAVRLGLGR